MQQEKLYKSIKYRIFPTDLQKEMLKHWFGADRWIWNHLVKRVFNENYNSKDVNRFKLRDEILDNGPEFVNRKTRTHVSDLLIDASVTKFVASHTKYNNIIRKQKRTTDYINVNKYRPKIQTKSSHKCSCVLNKKDGHTFKIVDEGINIRTTILYGRQTIKTKTKILIDCNKIKQLIFKKDYNSKYYMYIIYEADRKEININNKKIGIDMGMKTYLTCYSGEKSFIIEFPKDIIKLNDIIDNYQKVLSNKKINSKRYFDVRKKLSKSYKLQYNKKMNFINHVIKFLCLEYNIINIDRYNFDFKKDNFISFNRKLSVLSPATFILRLEQKAEEYGCKINVIPKGTPTTQTCSNCGNIKEKNEKLSLNDRTYKCNKCGYEEDRDINAAKNVFNYNS